MSDTILGFLKIGSQENITDLYENGTVYMNTLEYFRRVEDGELRGDPNEGYSDVVDIKNGGTFRIEGIDQDFKFINARYGGYRKTGNLYCLYSISSRWFPNPLDFRLDERNLDFGTHALIIKQPGVFIKKLEDELIKGGYNFKHGFVEYYENKVRLMNLTPFDKSNKYEYQKEFRFSVENEENEPLKINIGSMKSYAEIIEAKELLGLELQPKSNN